MSHLIAVNVMYISTFAFYVFLMISAERKRTRLNIQVYEVKEKKKMCEDAINQLGCLQSSNARKLRFLTALKRVLREEERFEKNISIDSAKSLVRVYDGVVTEVENLLREENPTASPRKPCQHG